MEEIAVIAPDKELFAMIRKIQKGFPEPFHLTKGFLDEGVTVARQLEKKGVKILVSRGGTTTKIRQSDVSLPVIDIPITGYDVLKLLDQARRISDRVAVIGVDSLVNGSEVVAPILGLKVEIFRVNSEEDVSVQIQAVREMGIKVVVGAKLAVELAHKNGMVGILLRSDESEVLKALDEASKVLSAIRRERELGHTLHRILDCISEGIVAVDTTGRINHFNETAEKVIGSGQTLRLGQSIFDTLLVPDGRTAGFREAVAKGKTFTGRVQDLNGVKYVFNLSPIWVDGELTGSILAFQELDRLQNLEQKVRRALYEKGHVAKYSFGQILSESEALRRVKKKAEEYARVDSTVLITGESGTGKEMFAQSLHQASNRSNGPFLAINCSALPEHLLESELFGYVEGAFTGARKGGKQGLFELAHRGTLFLDELAEMSTSLQARLLRVLEEKEVMRLGDDRVIPVDVRVFCATNKDLKTMVDKGEFREDLYYRINVLRLHLPPLRERPEDVLLLANFFLTEFARQYGKPKRVLSEEAAELLQSHHWPGNIRELRNVVERLVITVSGDYILGDDVAEALGETPPKRHQVSGYTGLDSAIREKEKEEIARALEMTGGNRMEAARLLGISRTTLWRRLKDMDH